MRVTIPNILTFARILLIPVLFLLFHLPMDWVRPACAFVFLFAAITDWFDGYLARRLQQNSKFGEFLDPVADKLIVVVALLLLTAKTVEVPVFWMVLPSAIIVCREIVISALREWMAEIGKRAKIRVSMLGKIKTVVQMTAIVLLLYHMPLFGISMFWLGFGLLQLAAVLTIYSMILYLKSAWPYLTKSDLKSGA